MSLLLCIELYTTNLCTEISNYDGRTNSKNIQMLPSAMAATNWCNATKCGGHSKVLGGLGGVHDAVGSGWAGGIGDPDHFSSKRQAVGKGAGV